MTGLVRSLLCDRVRKVDTWQVQTGLASRPKLGIGDCWPLSVDNFHNVLLRLLYETRHGVVLSVSTLFTLLS